MKQLICNILETECDAIIITTNGYVKASGECVMGKGIAKQIADVIPEIPKILGNLIRTKGNNVHILLEKEDIPTLVSFPVKPITGINNGNNVVDYMRHKFRLNQEVMGWAMKADINIIEQSLQQLVELANKHPEWKTILIPRVGCGAGELDWETIEPLCQKYLDDRFIACTFK